MIKPFTPVLRSTILTSILRQDNINSPYYKRLLNNFKRPAFTLAEVLITIGIVGIVSALTIPTLVTKYQKRATVEKLKMAYSMFTQALRTSVESNGDVANWEYSYGDMAETYLAPYIETLGLSTRYKMYTFSGSNTIYWGSWVSKGKIYTLKNGMTYSLIYDHGILVLMVDINGLSKPNRLGRDGFAFIIDQDNNRLSFYGEERSRAGLTDGGGYSCSFKNLWNYYGGLVCGALIKIDGWKISDDYPW
jgi:prepilin-type N-terminal cleavage/methylation domain-containing protein